MLRVYLLSLFLLGCHAQGAVIQANPPSFGMRAASTIKTVCLKHADQATHEEALDKFNKIQEGCSNLRFLQRPKSEEEASRLCIELRENMIQCIQGFVEKFESCLSSEESYLGQFLVDSYGNYSSYLCEHVSDMEKMDVASLECTGTFIRDASNDPSRVCYENSEVFGNTSSDVVITKYKLCSDLRSVRTCYGEKFETHCPSATRLRESALGLFKEALVPCQDVLGNNSTETSGNAVESSK